MLNQGLKNCASFSCHVEYVEYVECFRALQGKFWPVVSKFFNIFNIFNMTAERSTFLGSDSTWFNIFNMTAERSTFCENCPPFSCHVEFCVFYCLYLCRAQKIKHIQHIQHDSWKRHSFWRHDSTWFNIFNMTAERSTSCQKNAPFSRHVEFQNVYTHNSKLCVSVSVIFGKQFRNNARV